MPCYVRYTDLSRLKAAFIMLNVRECDKVSQLVVLFLCLIGLPIAGFFGYSLIDRIIKKLDKKDERKAELERLNQLYECQGCGRLSRLYQRELARYDLFFEKGSREAIHLDICPHCKEGRTFSLMKKDVPFSDAHSDCLPLLETEYAEYQQELARNEALLYRSTTYAAESSFLKKK